MQQPGSSRRAAATSFCGYCISPRLTVGMLHGLAEELASMEAMN